MDNNAIAKLPEVCVLMSTYNGEKYLREQIDSILAQKDVSVKLFVRDDGSSDITLNILQEYADKNLLEIVTFGGNFGPGKSFMELLYYVGDKYDYYAFADQDDIWKEEKLAVGAKAIGKADVPTLYCSNQMIYINGEETGLRYKSIPPHSLVATICGNRFSGCTIVFNKALATDLSILEHRASDIIYKVRMHDTWVIAVSELIGNVIYDEGSYIDYRIHANNTVGVSRRIDIFARRIKNFFAKALFGKVGRGSSLLAQELKRFCPVEDKEKERILDLFADAKHNKFGLLANRQIRQEWQDNRIIFIVKVLLGWL